MTIKKLPTLLGILVFVALVSACERIPSAGTRVSSSSQAFSRLATDIAGDCERMGGCTCIMDGIQTTCPIVFACLEAGFCELVAAP
jgi:hypothetical protein